MAFCSLPFPRTGTWLFIQCLTWGFGMPSVAQESTPVSAHPVPCRSLPLALRVGLGPSAVCCFVVLLQKTSKQRNEVLRFSVYIYEGCSNLCQQWAFQLQNPIRHPLRIRLKKPNFLKRMIERTGSIAVLVCHPQTEAPRTMQGSRPPHKHISGFLPARRYSQGISRLLLFSHNHIILAAPHHSTHALHRPEMLIACFLSRGSRLWGTSGSWHFYYFSVHCHSFVLVQSLNPLSN